MSVPLGLEGAGAVIPSLPLARRSDVRQIAFVPTDFDAALRFWTESMGVGPFFLLDHLPYRDVVYRGTPIAIDVSVALAYWGDIQIELIRQHDAGTISGYTESSPIRRDGLHHLLLETEDIDALHAAYLERGAVTLMTGRVPDAGRFIYIDVGDGGPHIELAEIAPALQAVFDHMRREAAHWDGRDPLRSLPPIA